MFLRYGKFAFIKNLYFLAHSHETAKKVLIYGGGLNLRFYFMYPFDEIVITSENISEDRRAKIETFCKKKSDIAN